jgi:hypothetical protein
MDSRFIERQYPPRKYDSVSGSNPYTMVVTNAEYGAGNYVCSHKSSYGAGWEGYRLFDFEHVNDNNGGYHSLNTYSSGVYVNSNAGTLDNSYYGEFITLQLPYQIRLTKFRLYVRSSTIITYIQRAPAEFKIYGSNNGTTWTEIHSASQMTRLVTNDYLGKDTYYFDKFLSNSSALYSYFGIVVNKLVSTSELTLNLGEWQLFGVEDTNLVNSSSTYNNNGYITFNTNNFVTIPNRFNPYYTWLNNGITFSLWFRGIDANSGTWGRLFDFGNNAVGTSPTF